MILWLEIFSMVTHMVILWHNRFGIRFIFAHNILWNSKVTLYGTEIASSRDLFFLGIKRKLAWFWILNFGLVKDCRLT